MVEWHKEADGVAWREENLPHKKLFSCLVKVPLPAHVSKKTGLTVAFEPTRVRVLVKGQPLVPSLERELSTAIKTAESTWTIEAEEEGRVLMLELCTREPGAQAWQKLFADAAIVVEKEEEDENPNAPKLDMEQIKRQRDKETGFGRIRIKGVEEMEARTKLNRFASTQPKEVQQSIGELLDQGATAIEVLNLLKEIAEKKGKDQSKE